MVPPRLLVLAAGLVLGVTGCTDGAGGRDPATPAAPAAPRGPAAPETPERSPAALPPGEDASVTRPVDGDTVAVSGGRTVRLIGIDTPETKDPRRPVECFGREAAARTAELLPAGTPVRLVYDVERHDRFGRILAYVHRRTDGLFVNAALVAEGYALPATYPPNVAHAEEFVELARGAREDGAGLWSRCGDDGEGPAVTAGGEGCAAAYPDVCLPPPPPDLDCADVGRRRFTVRAPDPHRFDADGNGVGCE